MMQCIQHLYPQGSGEIKLVIIDENKTIVKTRHDGDLLYRRDRNSPTTSKPFEGKRLIPAKEE